MSKSPIYYSEMGGHPDQNQLMTGKAIFTNAYAVIPKNTMRDIVTSFLPFWNNTRAWILARPLSGFSETFSHYIMEVSEGGGSNRPDDDEQAQSVLFVVEGEINVKIGEKKHSLSEGSYVYIPPACQWEIKNKTKKLAKFHWIRKAYEYVDGIDMPEAFVKNDKEIKPIMMENSNNLWATTRFVDPQDMRHDMHVNIVTFEPGGTIPFEETHVMEHGIYILQGKGVYKLNNDWVEVEAGDYLWLRAFCPQACYAGGEEQFRYLLYKDVNRHAIL